MSERPGEEPEVAPESTASTPADGATPPARRPSPGAQAASRARRIGGRPTPGPRTSAEPAADEADESAADLVAPVLERPKRSEAAAKPPTATAAEVSDRDEAEVLRRRLNLLRWVPAAIAAAVAVALAVMLVASSHGVWWAKASTGKIRNQVLAAAKTCLANTNSFDYRKLDEAEAAGLACATGKFRDSYKQSMETVIKKIAPQRQATQTVQVNKAGIETVSKDGKQWVILIYGQQQVTNNTTAANQPRLDILAAKVTMDKVGDKWLISALSAA